MIDDEPCQPTSAAPSRLRCTVKDLLVYVALAGLLCGGCVMSMRSADSRAKARLHAEKEATAIQEAAASRNLARRAPADVEGLEQEIKQILELIDDRPKVPPKVVQRLPSFDPGLCETTRDMFLATLYYELRKATSTRDDLDEAIRWRGDWERLAAYHAALKRKYQRAAIFPWMQVDADPPKPWIGDD
ncbi:MAG: hypothetical protein P4L85_08590 [Paludisphaera borealis]|uniref:hypothetical protein n=1 Tax=Paludisphaera borealis TaxID=1387353 RepID=UPI002844D090|nr:hypothetical protein [Paludisphaera borealis]MDR3619393.1 hypothetical protein [Paludisphaera borealis]